MASVSKNRQGKWVVRYRDAQDRQHSKVIPGPKANALKLKADIEARQALGHLYEAEPETLGVYLEGWLGREAQRVRASTVQRRREALRGLGVLDERGDVGDKGLTSLPLPSPRSSSLSIPEAGSRALTRAKCGDAATSSHLASEYLHHITAAEIEDAVSELASHAPRQAQIALAALKLALNDAETRGQRFDPRILKVKPPRYDEREPKFPTWDEVLRIALWMPEHVRRIVPIAALTGLRQGELIGLEEADLDLPNAQLTVRRSGDGPTKTKASKRTVDLPPDAVELLREQLLARRHTSDTLVFPAWQGGRMRPANFMGREFRPAVRRAGLDSVTFHDLRRTYTSLMLKAGVGVRTIADQLGHSDGGALLLRRYGFLYSDAGAVGAQALQRLLDSDGRGHDAAEEGAG